MGFIVRQKRTVGRSLGRIIPVEDSDLEYPNPPLEDEDDYVFMKTAKKSKVENYFILDRPKPGLVLDQCPLIKEFVFDIV
ncbi:hypothetical protein Tco_1291247 [Tanacetum coccineum]